MNNVDILYPGNGHMLIYGATLSGKTNLARYLLRNKIHYERLYVFTMTPNEWKTNETASKTKLNNESESENNSETYDVFEDIANLEEVFKTISNDIKDTVIIFDDINEQISTSNQIYKTLFTRSRHFNVMVINLAHLIKAVPPVTRDNSAYVWISAAYHDKSNLREYKDKYIQNINLNIFKNTLSKLPKYSFALIHDGKLETLTPNRVLLNEIFETKDETTNNEIIEIEVKKDIDVIKSNKYDPHVYNVLHGELTDSANANMNLINPINMNEFIDEFKNDFKNESYINIQKNNTGSGTYNDNSTTNMKISTNVQNAYEQKQLAYETKLIGLKLDEKYKIEQRKYRIREILMNGGRTRDEEIEAYKLMRTFTTDVNFKLSDMYKNAHKFGEMLFNENWPEIKPNKLSMLNDKSYVLENIIKNNVKNNLKVPSNKELIDKINLKTLNSKSSVVNVAKTIAISFLEAFK